MYAFRSAFAAGSVPKLSELCVHKLQDNVDTITDCKGMNFKILAPILERAKPESMMVIEDYNPYLMEYTGIYKIKVVFFCNLRKKLLNIYRKNYAYR